MSTCTTAGKQSYWQLLFYVYWLELCPLKIHAVVSLKLFRY